ncbi:6382_t:CDS:2 [Acaulospora morrowiae]|uniref:6382_t:CDS:1 n=1 Tax=Acaulospora morrowiae TaxID=94023 RepID=A0A9N9D063_9GLOM|nr:6382_t:CDS:2 [Acaulospora morrowiae]
MTTQQFFDDDEFANVPKSLLPIIRFFFNPLNDPKLQQESFLSNPFAFFSSFAKKKNTAKPYISFKGLNDVPIEFLSMICKNLEPTDIFALAGVNQHLRTILLDIENKQTQELWRNSRLEHSPFLDVPLPKGMTEQEFLSLTALERGCQFCGLRVSWVRIYWQYRVRACTDCYLCRFVSNSYLNRRSAGFYRTTESLEELKRLENNDKRRLEYIISYRKQRLGEIIDELSEEVVPDNVSIKSGYSSSSDATSEGVSLKYDPFILRKCPSYLKEWKYLDRPFTSRDEVKLRRKLDYEYQILEKHYSSS